MDLTILNVLHIVLIIFTIVVGTLLSIILYKVMKILDTLTEIVELYNKIKGIINLYSHLPEVLLLAFKKTFFGDNESKK